MDLISLLLALGANIVGSALMVITIAVAGWRETASIDHWTTAAKRFATIRPEMSAKEGIVGRDGKSALLSLYSREKNHFGVVAVSGRKLSPRLITPADTHAELRQGGLRFDFSSPTWTPLFVDLEQEDAQKWLLLFNQKEIA